MAKLPTRDMGQLRALAIAISTVSRCDGVIDGLCANTWMMPFYGGRHGLVQETHTERSAIAEFMRPELQ
jgi:hypothetical protein